MSERIGIDHPAASICPNAIDHKWWGRPDGWRHASVERLWLVEKRKPFILERHVGKEPWEDEVTVDLDVGTRLRYDISDFSDGREFGVLVTYFFRVESGSHAGQCVRTVDGDMPSNAADRGVTPESLGLRSADGEQQDHPAG